jgi:hypothetical protein
MAAGKKIPGNNEFATACILAAGLEPVNVRRIIIDMAMDAPMRIFVEMIGTDRFYQVVPPDLTGTKIEVLPGKAKP